MLGRNTSIESEGESQAVFGGAAHDRGTCHSTGGKKATSINFSQESAVTPASTRLMGTMEMGPVPTSASLLAREDFRPFWWIKSFCYDLPALWFSEPQLPWSGAL